MRIVITGGLGQLGIALQSTLGDHDLIVVDLPEIDITDKNSVTAVIDEVHPELIIHCAAYTDVDGAARNPDIAHKVNALGTQNVALACQKIGAEMVHISTNEVFSGDDPGGYHEWRPLNPINPYGRSKAAAENHVKTIVQKYYIVRTAWLFGPGGRNFVHAILNRANQTGQLKVVADEVGNPTYVNDLAQAITQLISYHQFGVYHFVNSGACSRWAFANEILRLAGLVDVVNKPILSRDFKRLSTPPSFGVLQNNAGSAIGISLRPWEEALKNFIDEHALFEK